MSYDTFTALLSGSEFPFVSDFLSRTVLLTGLDGGPRAPKNAVPSDVNNSEIPQHYYLQNVMPTDTGLASVGYEQVVAPFGVGITDFDQCIALRDTDENNFLLSPAGGKNYIFTANYGAWQSVSPFVFAGGSVTRAYVNGRTFVCYQRDSIREYDVGANTFLPVAFTGKTVTDIDGISASNNYLLWWDNITVGWSSLVDPTDLTPNIQTGAASAIPQDVKGPIQVIVPVAGGFIIFTTKNAVAAMYTNNARAPFVFREIQSAGGVNGTEQVSLEASGSTVYAYTTNGAQEITLSSAKSINGALTDFLAGRLFESFDLSTLTFTLERLFDDFAVKVTFISGRYLVISYGKKETLQVYTHAIVYDYVLKRYGKLRLDHVDSFPYPYPNLIGSLTSIPPKRAVAFLQKDGAIQLLIMDDGVRQDQGVLLLGKFQLVRQKAITFQSLEIENLTQAYPPDVYLLVSPQGNTLGTPQQLTLLSDTGTSKKYGAPVYSGSGAAPARTGINFSTLLVGKFELVTALYTVTRHGNR